MSAAYDTIESLNTDLRVFSLVAKASGSPITSGTVNWYLKALTGTNAGKWWKTADGTWAVAETANAMTHQADGHWTRDPVVSAVSPWTDGAEFLEYAKESGDLHIPTARKVKAAYTPSADSSQRVDIGKAAGTAWESGAITAAVIADGAIDTATFASGTTIPRVTLADTLTAYTGNTPQTGDSYSFLTSALAESYRSTGATGTMAQLLYEILAGLLDHSITSTTKTSRKIDGTTAKTYTLDSATAPTSITETT